MPSTVNEKGFNSTK